MQQALKSFETKVRLAFINSSLSSGQIVDSHLKPPIFRAAMSKTSQYRFTPRWLHQYRRSQLAGDLYAGLTVGVMLIPQGMAYALIVGVPPVYGLYTAIIAPLLYAFLGTSRKLSVAPTATESLLVASGISALAISGTEQYLVLVTMLTLMVGVIQILLGFARMGFITNLLSKPVIVGFTAAAAIIIAVSQLRHLLGISIDGRPGVFGTLQELVANISETNLLALAISVGGIAIILLSKKISAKLPGPLLAVVLSIGVVYWSSIDGSAIDLLKDIPAGLPAFSMPALHYEDMISLLPLAITVSLVSFMESYSIAKAIDNDRTSHILPNRELIALGAANLTGAFFRTFPAAGGFSRSAVNQQAGANTPLAGIISATLVGLALLLFTQAFSYLPKAILASIIMVSIVKLVDIGYITRLFRANRLEFVILSVTFITTVLTSMVSGILTGIALSILRLIYQSANPHIAELGRLKGHHEFRNVKRFKDLDQWPNILILRVDASLSFINIQYLKDYVLEAVKKADNHLDTLILDAGPMSNVDATAANGLRDLLEELHSKDIRFIICDLIGPVRDTFHRTGLIDHIGVKNIFFDLNEAVRAANTNNPGRYKEYALQSDYKSE